MKTLIKLNARESRVSITRYPARLGPGASRVYRQPTAASVGRLRRVLGAQLARVESGPSVGAWEARID